MRHYVLDGMMAELVRFPKGAAPFDATTGQPVCEAVGIVVPSDLRGTGIILDDRQAPHLAAPGNKRGIEQTAILQICDKGGRRLVGLATGRGETRANRPV